MKRLAIIGSLVLVACGGKSTEEVVPEGLPLPVTMLVGQEVMVLPLTLLSADTELGWTDQLGERDVALRNADSVIARHFEERAPEVRWVLPERLAEVHRRNPTIVADPYRMPGAILRGQQVDAVPDPLRAQLRTLAGFVGGRFVVVPSALFFTTTPEGLGEAQLVVVVADVRTGRVAFRTVAKGQGDSADLALSRALRILVPQGL